MAESVEEILEFLRRNKFTRAEAALRGELGSRSDLKGPVPKPEEGLKVAKSGRGPVKQGGDASRELIVKEIECGTVNASVATDLYPWNFGGADDFMEILISEQPRHLRKVKSEAPDNPWSSSKNGDEQPVPPVASSSCSGPWKEFSVVKTVFPAIDDAKKDRKKRTEAVECPEVDLPSVVVENNKQELPRLAPVKLKSEDKQLSVHWEEKNERHGLRISGTEDNAFSIGAFLDVPIGQEINSTGVGKRAAGSSWLSVSQGIAEDNSDLVSGFATVGDGLSESVDYANEYWDSDEYDDDDDVGYMRQPIEDETWFLAHEIDYPSDNEKGAGHSSVPDQQERVPAKDEDDDQSFAEGDSYFSGEQYFPGKNLELAAPEDPIGLPMAEMYARGNVNDLIADYDGQLMHPEELHLMRSDSVWQGFVPQNNELTILGNGRVPNDRERPRPDDLCMDDDQHGSVRSIGVGINSDAADIGSEVRESLLGGSSEGDLEYFHDHDIGISGFRHSQHDTGKNNLDRLKREKARKLKPGSDQFVLGSEKVGGAPSTSYADSGFSFPPMRADDLLQAKSHKSLWSSKGNLVSGDDTDDFVNGLIGTDDKLASWRQKSSDSSPAKSSREENTENAERSSTASSNCGYADGEYIKKDQDDNVSEAREDPRTALEDEEAAAVQEQVRQIRAQEEEFETFNLKIVHRKNRTGFEEDKNFHVVLNSVIAGRYHVTEYLGSAAFSKAIQAHDLHTGMDVCVKIIKNNKDFFDQSLDEIKLLKYVNKHDPSDKYHLLRLYDYFYYREHLLIVCELLKANLYEFHKFNRESGGEVYFTMPRLQSITIQCLEALQFLHVLGLIHCDLKPENILVKSYSRCEVKVIDLGSSCFETDHLCSYVQSRSYRAPEVILGLPYDKKIDIWSLGCILAELCTGNVLFQNDSPATLLARVIGIIVRSNKECLLKVEIHTSISQKTTVFTKEIRKQIG
ncbi:Serine/threonine-protein kinase AFC2 [Acorus calamus]|uniref:Serine/threonine-protein kinase AFC2 n=1 Tax=Acorus calamus TaxID=4465 RepID=A0AAV9DMW1_ACOCL|nr:Serine/threonine-protein kinase AFC2 [Acorus calamus]